MGKHYAGIGSRQTPIDILAMMTKIATALEKEGWILRSGGADGADTAFSNGCINKEVFPPWDGFNNHRLIHPVPDDAYSIAAELHPGWAKLTSGGRTLMARNIMQVCGPKLNDNSRFVVCWTKDACISTKERTYKTGGTGQAIAHASNLGIPVFNLARIDHYERFHNFITKAGL